MTTPAPFSDLDGIRAAIANAPVADSAALAGATERNAMLTKPPAALGQLEDLAVWYASWRGEARPVLDTPQVVIFAGNHGVAAQGVSAFPIEVTVQMVANFRAGGAAINQLANAFGATMDVVELELDRPTEDFTQTAAMSEADLVAAMSAGWNAVNPKAGVLVTGEMGIGNTTSAAAIAAALYGGGAETWVGRGSGVDDEGLARKRAAVDAGLACHAGALDDPLEVLRRLGGREIAAMAGAMLAARHHRVPVIIDGFICTSAAAVLASVAEGALDHAVAGHVSAEGAHSMMLEKIGKAPLLSLGLRLGEGSGAALAIGVLKGAVACHSGMATFAEAGVSDSDA